MNNLGGMVFIVVGIAFAYWVATGRAVNFINALNSGNATNPNTIPTTPGCPPGQNRLYPGGPCVPGLGGINSFLNENVQQGIQGSGQSNVAPNNTGIDWNSVA